MKKESYINDKPEYLPLDGPECHALAYAFLHNQETIRELKKIMSPEEQHVLKLAASMMPRSLRLDPAPNPKMNAMLEDAYIKVALAELNRLEVEPLNPEKPFENCSHTIEDHEKALVSVVKKFSPSAAA